MNSDNAMLLRVRDLTRVYGQPSSESVLKTRPEFGSNICPDSGAIVSLANVSFDLWPGEGLGIVGESGSGKSTLLKALYFDQEPKNASAFFSAVDDGQVSLFSLSDQRKRYIRDHLMGMVYQNPRDGLDFRISAGGNVAEKLLIAGCFHVGRIRDRASFLLPQTEVQVARMDQTPALFSGGLQQRVQIAKAIANEPPLLFLDEATS